MPLEVVVLLGERRVGGRGRIGRLYAAKGVRVFLGGAVYSRMRADDGNEPGFPGRYVGPRRFVDACVASDARG